MRFETHSGGESCVCVRCCCCERRPSHSQLAKPSGGEEEEKFLQKKKKEEIRTHVTIQVALCGVRVKAASGTTVQIQVNPSAPSEFGENHRDADGSFHLDGKKIVSALKQMTGENEERFVVTVRNRARLSLFCLTFLRQDTTSTPTGDVVANVLIRNLPSDADLAVSDTIAEFSAISGDSFWKRSGLQIERLEVGDKKQPLPTWSIVTIATVLPTIVAIARKRSN